MSITAPPTITALKSHFLSTQLQILSTPLTPSASFLASNTTSTHALRQKNIDSAIQQTNERLKKHNKLRYGPQAQRHVVEQIDGLYWGKGEQGVVCLGVGEEWVERGADYAQASTITSLPPSWPDEGIIEQHPDEPQRFVELQQRLTELNTKRDVATKRLEDHKRLRALVEVFGTGEVQENLVGRNGEVEVEMEKMRRLVARVERGMVGIEERGDGEGEGVDGGEEDWEGVDGGEEDWEGEDERKVLGILG